MKTKYFSYTKGKLASGCLMCVQGKKLVMFVTGICNMHCFYCPISDQKANKDVIFANERPIKKLSQMIEEAKACDAKGAGLTGGDPLLKIDRTIRIIKTLKKEFGKKFHIHLYTPLKNISKQKLEKLYATGLDEIRFHPLVWDDALWDKINLALDYSWDIGVEIPSIPEYEKDTKKLIDFLSDKIKFLNLNELEISDTNAQNLGKLKPKDSISYGIKGSQELALKLLNYCRKYSFNVHYCTCKLKDKVQMANRIKRRAKNTALKTDKITKEGMLIRGAVYLEKPSFSYRSKLAKLSDKDIKNRIQKLNRLKLKNFTVDKIKLRLLTDTKTINKYKKHFLDKNLFPAIVEEYPTYDGMEIELELL